jgi:hypothetical protein
MASGTAVHRGGSAAGERFVFDAVRLLDLGAKLPRS